MTGRGRNTPSICGKYRQPSAYQHQHYDRMERTGTAQLRIDARLDAEGAGKQVGRRGVLVVGYLAKGDVSL